MAKPRRLGFSTRVRQSTNESSFGIALALVLCALALVGCSHPQSAGIRFGLASMPTTLDPRFATDAASSRIGRLIYQRLIEFDERVKPIGGIADWERPEPKHFRFTLNDKAMPFQNGDALTSADVKATYDFILDAKNGSPHRSSIAMIERIETPDARTIDFFLNRADPLFPGYLVIGILPKKLIESRYAFDHKPLGSGPFKFVGWPEDGRLMLARMIDAQAVEFLHVPNPTVRVLKLMRGEIDVMQNDLPPELVTHMANNRELTVGRQRGSNFAYLGFNMQDPVLSKLPVRQAIACAIDRQGIIDHVFGQAARPAEAVFPPDHWAGNPDLQGCGFNPDQARRHLKEAGFGSGSPLKIIYKTSSDPFRVRLATILQSQLAKVGIDVEIRSYDWGTFYGDIKNGHFQLFSLAWIGIKTPDIFRYAFHSESAPPKGANRGRFNNPELDALVAAAEGLDDLNAQAKIYAQIQTLLLQQLPYVPLWYEDHVYVARNSVHGYATNFDGNFDGLVTATKTN